MQQLTDLQRETLEFIRGFVRINGFAPSRPEIAKALKIKHKSGVDSRLFALERKAWIELKPGSPRYIRLLDDDLPLIVGGSVAAGEPILAEERVTARIPRSVAEAFRSQPDFFVRVEGDSLDRLGFVTGSVVGIKAQSDAENGEVIVARLGDQVTLKRYFRKDERHVELRPESTNPEHQPIQVDLEQVAFEVCGGVAVGALIGGRVQWAGGTRTGGHSGHSGSAGCHPSPDSSHIGCAGKFTEATESVCHSHLVWGTAFRVKERWASPPGCRAPAREKSRR